jgi:hypothetical protein
MSDTAKAKKRLATFLDSRREMFAVEVISLYIGRALIFYQPPELKRVEELILEYAASIRAETYKIDQEKARRQIDELYSENRDKQREMLRHLPGLVHKAMQEAMSNLELIIQAAIFQGMGFDIWTRSTPDPSGKEFQIERRVRKGKIEKKTLRPSHRPTGSNTFDRGGFLADVEAIICKLAKELERAPKQAQVADNLKSFRSEANVFNQRYRRCKTGKPWKVFVRDVLHKAGISLKKQKTDKKS